MIRSELETTRAELGQIAQELATTNEAKSRRTVSETASLHVAIF